MARSNTTSVPEAKSAMNRFKYEVDRKSTRLNSSHP